MISQMIKGKNGEGNLLTAVGRNWEGRVNKGFAGGLQAHEDQKGPQVGGRSLPKTNRYIRGNCSFSLFFKIDDMMKLFCARSLLSMMF